MRKESKVAIPCGIPYIFGTLENTDQDILPDAGLINAGVEILVDEVTSLGSDTKTAILKGEGEISYEKLIWPPGPDPWFRDG